MAGSKIGKAEFIHVAYFPPWSAWIHRIQARLQNSTSKNLVGRLASWRAELAELSCALSTKMSTLQRAIKLFNEHWQRLEDELQETQPSLLEKEASERAAHVFRDENLPYDLVLAVDSFVFESRSAYEILGKFLKGMFKEVLGQPLSENQLVTMLNNKGIDTAWIEDLARHRKIFFHEGAPWIALEVVSVEPRSFKLLILPEHIRRRSGLGGAIPFERLLAMYHGFDSSLRAIEKFILDKIEECERHEPRVPNPKARNRGHR